MKILAGVHTDYERRVVLDGEPLALHGPARRRAPRHRDHPPGAQPRPRALGRREHLPRPRAAHGRWAARHGRAWTGRPRRCSTAWRCRSRPSARSALRIGEQQLVEIAKALSLDARLLIMDEPTSALSDAEVARTSSTSSPPCTADGVDRDLHLAQDRRGLRPRRPRDRAARRRARRHGRGGRDRPARADPDDGRPPARTSCSRAPPRRPTTRCCASRASRWRASRRAGHRAVGPISLTSARGEVLGVAGLLGAGRTELLEALFGVHRRRRCTGDDRRRRPSAASPRPRDAIAAGLAFVTEDRKTQSLIMPHVGGPEHHARRAARFLRFNVDPPPRRGAAAVRRSIGQLRIKTAGPAAPSTRCRAATSRRSPSPSAC